MFALTPFQLTEGFVFFAFAAAVLLCAVGVVVVRNPVYAVLLMVAAFFSSAALFIMQGAEFLGLLLIIVYVGAIAVLFLFVVMMLDIRLVERARSARRHLPLAILVAGLLLAELTAVVLLDNRREEQEQSLTPISSHDFAETTARSGARIVKPTAPAEPIVSRKPAAARESALLDTRIVKPTAPSNPSVSRKPAATTESALLDTRIVKPTAPSNPLVSRKPAATTERALLDNTTALGLLIYSEYLVIFEITGLLLLLAMLGAIVLTHRHREEVARQSVVKQKERGERARLVKIISKDGI